MPVEPAVKKTVAFIDGQNLYRAVKDAFGYTYPNYEVTKLALEVCQSSGLMLEQVRFYTGVPEAIDDAFWHGFWAAKMRQMSWNQVHLFSRPLRYRNHRIRLPDGAEHAFLAAEEKGIDVRIALDIIHMANHREYDVALVFSQDQDLSEVADEIRSIAREQDRWIKMASAFPVSPTYNNRRGINSTDWIKFDRALYDRCLDRRDYRPKPTP